MENWTEKKDRKEMKCTTKSSSCDFNGSRAHQTLLCSYLTATTTGLDNSVASSKEVC